MERKYLSKLIDWKDDPHRKPLMIWGARQVGKSYLVEELFAKVYFPERYLKIDLSDDVEFVNYAEKNSNLTKVLQYIELHYNFHADSEHLLFFDEAQECPSVVKMMKHFCENRRDIPVIVSGSLVRLRLRRESKISKKGFLFPTGKMNELTVYPLTFDEFLYNFNKNKFDYLQSHFAKKETLDSTLHEEFMDDFRIYMFIGGMPEVVNTFLYYKDDTIKALQKAEEKLKEIYDEYLADMDLYQASIESIVRTRLIYNDIFKQLNKENKNFKITSTIPALKNRDAANPYFWLTTSKVVLQSFCVKETVTLPLLKENDSLFRLYLSDVGMFARQSHLSYKTFLLDKSNSLSGVHYENYIAEELTAHAYGLYYWKGKRNSELEFLIDVSGEVVAIDSKKSRGTLDSLKEFRTHNKKTLAIKVSQNNYGFDEANNILTLPFYYFTFYLNSLNA